MRPALRRARPPALYRPAGHGHPRRLSPPGEVAARAGLRLFWPLLTALVVGLIFAAGRH